MADEIINLIIQSDVSGADKFTESLDQVGAASQAAVSRVDALGKSIDDNTQTFVYSSRQISEQNSALRQIGPSYDSAAAAIIRLTRENDQLQRATQGVQRMMDTQNMSTSVGGEEIAKYAARQAELTLATNKLQSGQASLGQLLREQPGLYSVLSGQLSNATRGTLAHGEATEGLSVRTRVLEHALTGMIGQLSNGISPVQAIGSELGRLSLAFRAFEFILSGPGLALAALGAAAYVLHNNFSDTESSIRVFNNTLKTLGQDVPGRAEELEQLVVKLRDSGVAAVDARKAVLDVLTAPGISKDPAVIGAFTDLGHRMSELQGDATKTVQMTDELIAAFGKSSTAVVDLADKLGIKLKPELVANLSEIEKHQGPTAALQALFLDWNRAVLQLSESMGGNRQSIVTLTAAWNDFLTKAAQSEAWKTIEGQLKGVLAAAGAALTEWKLPENNDQWEAWGTQAIDRFVKGFILGISGDSLAQQMFAGASHAFSDFNVIAVNAGTAAATAFIEAYSKWFKEHFSFQLFQGVSPFNQLPQSPPLPQGQQPGEPFLQGLVPQGQQAAPSATAPLPPKISPQSYNMDSGGAVTAATMLPYVSASLDVFRSGGMASRLLPLMQAEAQASATNSVQLPETPVTAANSDITEENTNALKELSTNLGTLPVKIGDTIAGAMKISWQGTSIGGGGTPYPGAANMAAITLPSGSLPDSLISSLIKTESGGNQFAPGGGVLTSSAGALGLTQVLPSTGAGMGFSVADLSDATKNIQAGEQYLVQMLHQFGDLRTALMAYNWGPGNIQQAQAGIKPIPASVEGYAGGILSRTAFTGTEELPQLTAAARTLPQVTTIPQATTKALGDYVTKNEELLAVDQKLGYEREKTTAFQQIETEATNLKLSAAQNANGESQRSIFISQQQQAWLGQHTSALAVASEEIGKQTSAVRGSTEAYTQNTAQGLQADIMEQARRESVAKGITVQESYNQLVETSATSAINSVAKQVDAQKQQIAAAQAVAAVAGDSAKAAKEAEIQNQATLLTQDAVNRANIDGKTIDADRIASIKAQAVANLTENEAIKETIQLRQQDIQIANQRDVTKLEESLTLQGKTSDEIRTQITLAQAKNQLEQTAPLATVAEREATYKLIEARELENQKLREIRQQQALLNEEIKSIADTVINTLGGALDKILSGQKITDWGALFKQTMQQIASTIIQTEIIKPLIGSVLSGLGANQAAQQYGTLGSTGGLLGLGNIAKIFGIGNDTAGAATGSSGGIFGSGSGGIFGGISNLFSGTSGLQSAGLATTLLNTADTAGAVTASTTALSAGAAEGVGGGLLGGLGLGGIGSAIGSAIPYIGPLIAAIPIISSLIGPKPSTMASGSLISLTGGGVGDVRSSGNAQNDATSNQISSTLSTFLQNLQQVTGGGFVSGSLNVQATTKGIKTSYSGPLGNIDAQFADAQTAITQFELAFLHNIENVSDTLKTVLSHVTDPAQLSAALAVAKAYDSVATAFDSMFSSIEDATKQVGPYSKILDQINTQYNALIASAQQYGLSIDPIAAAYSAAQQRLIDDFNKNISDAMIGLSDPFNQTMKAELAQASQRLSDATAIGADVTQVEKFNQANLEKIALSASASLGSVAQHLGEFITTLGDSFDGLFKNIENQLTSVYTSSAGLTQLSGTDQFSQTFNAIITQAEAATKSALNTFTNPDVLNTVLDAITGVQNAAFDRLKTDFSASIMDLSTSATDPLQAAVTKEVEAGQERLTIAKALGADLQQTALYNDQNLLRIEKAADPSSTIAGLVKNAGDTLAASIGSVLQTTKGPFQQALESLNTAFGALIAKMDALGNSTEDVTPILQAYADQIDALRASFNAQIKDATLAITDPVQAALNIELKAGRQRVADAQAIGADLAAVDTLNALNLQKVYDSTQQAVGSIADLSTAIDFVVGDLKGPFVQALDALNAAFAKVDQSTEATKAYNDALTKLKDTFNSQIDDLALAITDPVQAALNTERKAGEQRVKDAIAVGGDLSRVDAYNVLSLKKVFDATQAAAASSLDFASSLATLKSALDQLKTGSLSGLTPQQQMDAALKDYRDKLAISIANPTTENIQATTQSGTNVVQLAEQIYGNDPRTAKIRNEVTSGLQGLSDAVKKLADDFKKGGADLSKILGEQIDYGESIADSMDATALEEFKRTGVHDTVLEEESRNLRANIAEWKAQLASGKDISQTYVDRNKFQISMYDQELSIGRRTLAALDSTANSAEHTANSGASTATAAQKYADSISEQYATQASQMRKIGNQLQAQADFEAKTTSVVNNIYQQEADAAFSLATLLDYQSNAGHATLDQLRSQANAAYDVAKQLYAQADLESARTGVKNNFLRQEADFATSIGDQLNRQANQQGATTQVEADRTKLTIAQFQQQADIGDRIFNAKSGQAGATMSGYDVAIAQLATERQIAADATALARESLAAQVVIANQIIAAQKAAADAFTNAVNVYQDILNRALANNQTPPAPPAAAVPVIPSQPPDWHPYHLSTPAGWVGEIWTSQANFATWSGLGARIGPEVATNYGNLYAASVYTPNAAYSDVWGTGAQAEAWRGGGATATPFQHGGMTAFPGWALVGEGGPEFLHLPAGAKILPHGISPPPTAPANDNAVSEMRRMREELKAELAALRQMTQAAAVQANRDAKSVAGETGALHNTVRFSNGPIRRVV